MDTNVTTDIKRSKRRVLSDRKSINQGELVNIKPLFDDTDLILLAKPTVKDVNLSEWYKHNIEDINRLLYKNGSILFRGFNLDSDADFVRYMDNINVDLVEYVERSSPRKTVAANVYTSTLYPNDETICLHNENTASISFALKVWFFCAYPPSDRGETPVADARKILKRIDSDVLEKFRKVGWMLVRNYGKYLAYDWNDAFAGRSKKEIEQYCKDNEIEMEWTKDDGLRTVQRRSATLFHPVTGEEAWFNHIAFWHRANLRPDVLSSMLKDVGENGLPFDTYYGDGSRIPDDVARHLHDAILAEKVIFPWEKGDLLLIDNIITSHGREKFEGKREIRVAMGEGYSRPAFEV
jgi:hypothetical protein